MFSTKVWYGELPSSTLQNKRVNLYSRLGGNFLGCLDFVLAKRQSVETTLVLARTSIQAFTTCNARFQRRVVVFLKHHSAHIFELCVFFFVTFIGKNLL